MGLFEAFGQGGSLQTGGTLPKQQALLDQGMPAEKDSVLGMTPSNFSAVLGSMGAAIGPQGSWQSKLGALSAQMGQAKLTAQAAQIQDMKNKMFLQSLLDAKPGAVPGSEDDPLANTPEGFYRGLGVLGDSPQHERTITIKHTPLTPTSQST